MVLIPYFYREFVKSDWVWEKENNTIYYTIWLFLASLLYCSSELKLLNRKTIKI